ncbi:MATE family efflux transporter [uncultured Algimonas sp.]|uniref:MATE family efflux transporter n=1 Tax=uncultured Algimonas sp. TaxID=1547920 RepID=UPI0026045A66|nr:MATE family efflux transporter [uncultured Algimonas sp.]
MSGPSHPPLSARAVFNQSWPIMLANAAAPVVGLVDTFVVGRFVGTTALAGIGLGAVIYGIVYWGFGFLRMSTAGLAAQDDGADDVAGVQGHILRAIPLGLVIGTVVFAAQMLLLPAAFAVFTAAPYLESEAATYIQARLWGLPATLGTIALMGWFVGISRAGLALQLQIVLNLVNIVLSPVFVIVLGAGLYGVGLASAVAEWCGFAMGLMLMRREFIRRGGLRPGVVTRANLLDPTQLKRLGVANSNIFIRTLTLTLGFNFFGNAAASEGSLFMAANHIHMQLITMSALVLDAFAHTAEAVSGAAYGARDRARFMRAVRLTTRFSCAFALLLGAVILLGGPFLIDGLTVDPDVRQTARDYLPYAALAPVIGFAAYQMDGIFIGTTHTAEMRNAGIASVAIYIGAHFLLTPVFGATGIWLAFLVYYAARAVTLAPYLPRITARLTD